MRNIQTRKSQIFNAYQLQRTRQTMNVLLELRQLLGLQGDFSKLLNQKVVSFSTCWYRLIYVLRQGKMARYYLVDRIFWKISQLLSSLKFLQISKWRASFRSLWNKLKFLRNSWRQNEWFLGCERKWRVVCPCVFVKTNCMTCIDSYFQKVMNFLGSNLRLSRLFSWISSFYQGTQVEKATTYSCGAPLTVSWSTDLALAWILSILTCHCHFLHFHLIVKFESRHSFWSITHCRLIVCQLRCASLSYGKLPMTRHDSWKFHTYICVVCGWCWSYLSRS